MRILVPFLFIFLVSCGSQYYYVVRHAEKAAVVADLVGNRVHGGDGRGARNRLAREREL